MAISDLNSLQFMAGDKHSSRDTLGMHVIHVVYILASLDRVSAGNVFS
jgi:hypothetical protein